jgi:hypothetical protein
MPEMTLTGATLYLEKVFQLAQLHVFLAPTA